MEVVEVVVIVVVVVVEAMLVLEILVLVTAIHREMKVSTRNVLIQIVQ